MASEVAKPSDAEDWSVFKERGNELFKNAHYEESVHQYSEAITRAPSALLLSNRAFAYIRMDCFGAAIEDANAAIALDPTFAKAYFRLGAAYVGLFKYIQAQDAFKRVIQMLPKDRLARERFDECKKEIRRIAFSQAIATDRTKSLFETLNIKSVIVEESYSGPVLKEDEKLSLEFILELIPYLKSQKVLHRKYVWMILSQLEALYRSEKSSLVYITLDSSDAITICGDTHGQFYDTLNIFEMNGMPSLENPYLFNGDFVDRGSFSVENILVLLCYHLYNPKVLTLLRGNHEGTSMNSLYGFAGEVAAKYDETTMKLFSEFFHTLPLAAVIEDKVFVCHGGLFSTDGVTLKDVEKIDRFREIPDSGLMCDLLWNDPMDANGRIPNRRGVGIQFGPDVTSRFLKQNNLKFLVRSHEMKEEGYEVAHDGKCITIFSAPNYCDQGDNKGAFIRFEKSKGMEPSFVQFKATQHPNVPAMAYAKNMFGM